jgi:hypothetical protein
LRTKEASAVIGGTSPDELASLMCSVSIGRCAGAVLYFQVASSLNQFAYKNVNLSNFVFSIFLSDAHLDNALCGWQECFFSIEEDLFSHFLPLTCDEGLWEGLDHELSLPFFAAQSVHTLGGALVQDVSLTTFATRFELTSSKRTFDQRIAHFLGLETNLTLHLLNLTSLHYTF